MRTLLQDLHYAVRQLRKSPSFTLLVTLTVALGIGANTALFSMINGFLRPLPVKSPDELVVFAGRIHGDETGFRYRLSYPALQDFRARAGHFANVFGWTTWLSGLNADGKTTEVLFSAVTGDYFTSLGVQPAAGRLFLPGEGENATAETNLVLGYSYWQKRFAGDLAVVGRQVRLDNKPARIIGVAPRGFCGLYAGAEMQAYLPLSSLVTLVNEDFGTLFTNRNLRLLTAVGRIKPGVGMAEAQSEVDVVGRRLEEQFPATDKGSSFRLIPERLARPEPMPEVSDRIPMVRRFVLILGGLVLLLACMNVANIMLVRATVRQREMAIRVALGSGRSRLMCQMLTESLLLAALGSLAGLLLGQWGSDVSAGMIDLATDLPTMLDFHFDWRVFTYALVAAVSTGVLIGIWPALRAARANANAVLHGGARTDGSGGGRARLRGALVVAQVAGSLMLLIVAGLFVRSLERAQHMDLGFDANHVLNVRMDPHQVGYNQQRGSDFFAELERRLRVVPGVESVSTAYSVPLGYISDGDFVSPEGKPVLAGTQRPLVGSNSVDAGYFGTMQIPILRGRGFRESDNEKSTRVVVVNQTAAARFWPNQDPIGKRFRSGVDGSGPLWEVVGVARDGKYLVVFEHPLPFVYFPMAQKPYSMRTVQVRTAVPPVTLSARVEREIHALDADMPIADLRTMRQSLEGMMGYMIFRIGAFQAGAMGVLGLALAIIGVYGVVSYSASQRTREIGIRMALGAQPSEVRGMVLSQGARLVVAGVAVGLLGSLALARLVVRVLLVSSTDPGTFTAITILLAAIALFACYLPARRAMRIDPMIALRHE